ncbi:CRISPR-associated helicase Cas3' [bacterium]|nr:CRISPR-associated helicase Cas3' [bacterium]
MFFAHSENDAGKKHSLKEHLIATAERASSFAPSESLSPFFYLAGLMHDVGKFQDGFQQYLEQGKPRTPHAGIGAFIASQMGKHSLPLQFVIQGHHAGMPDNQGRKTNIDEYSTDPVIGIAKMRFDETFPEARKNPDLILPTDTLLAECLTRFLFSALTDSDWLDTERHFTSDKSQARVSSTLDHETLIKALERKFAQLPSDGTINLLRTKARTESAVHFDAPRGFFSLQLPTGLGKTLTSVYWALLHARYHQLKRIIIVLPYLNIIDQTATILGDVFGKDSILEHHSGMVEEGEKKDMYEECSVGVDSEFAKRLACENWDAPIIVTTSVQFFESLFSNRPFKCRKNHNIAESVVIFDEVQTLPKEYVEPIIIMLKNIEAIARTSFLFCTATQPAFIKREGFDGIENIRPLITKPDEYFDKTQRVNYVLLNGLQNVSMDFVTDELLKEAGSFLAIVNTKSVARKLFQRVLKSETHDRYYHLSTTMCPHHRKKTIAHVIEDLKKNKRLAVISTQLVEAGVDFDFPCVYRAIAPLDAVIQAAGRCNRNGILSEKGRVVLFNLEQQKMPDKTYRACADWAMGIIKDDIDMLHNAETYEEYYKQITQLFVNADNYKITDARKRFNFKEVHEGFKFIDDLTTSLFVKGYSNESKSLLDEITKSIFITKNQYRRLQQFSVQVFPNFMKDYSSQIEVFNESIHIWHGQYDDNIGIAPIDVEMVF